ncbi:MAG: OmpA family protein, partial [Planktomarina sp.]
MLIKMYKNLRSLICVVAAITLITPVAAYGHGKIDCDADGINGPRCLGGLDIQSLPPKIRQNHVFFTAGGARLDGDATKQLDALASLFADDMFKAACVRLIGHTDAIGPSDVNMQLSLLRSKAVADYLITKMGDNMPELSLIGRGESQP